MTSRLETPRPAAVTAYLRRATWGLPRAQQQALWDELEEHLLGRAAHLELGGLSPTHALLQATRELGPPSRVTLGMTQVYAMPKLLIAAGTAALALSAALYALAGGNGGNVITLPVLTAGLLEPTCVQSKAPSSPTIVIVNTSTEDGVTCFITGAAVDVTGRDQAPRYLPGSFISERTLSKLATDLGGTVKITQGGFLEYSPKGWTRPGPFLVSRSLGVAGGLRYFPLVNAIGIISNRGEVTVSGYDRPTIQTSTRTYALGSTADRRVGASLYQYLTMGVLEQVVPQNELETGGTPRRLHQIQTRLPAGEVVMLVTRYGRQYTADYAPVGQGGLVSIRSLEPRLRFTRQPSQLGITKNDLSAALLVRVSNIPLNQLKTGIFVPAQLTSTARK